MGAQGQDYPDEKSLVADGERHVHEHAAALEMIKTECSCAGSYNRLKVAA